MGSCTLSTWQSEPWELLQESWGLATGWAGASSKLACSWPAAQKAHGLLLVSTRALCPRIHNRIHNENYSWPNPWLLQHSFCRIPNSVVTGTLKHPQLNRGPQKTETHDQVHTAKKPPGRFLPKTCSGRVFQGERLWEWTRWSTSAYLTPHSTLSLNKPLHPCPLATSPSPPPAHTWSLAAPPPSQQNNHGVGGSAPETMRGRRGWGQRKIKKPAKEQGEQWKVLEGTYFASIVNKGVLRFESLSVECSIPDLLSPSTVNTDCWIVLPCRGDPSKVTLYRRLSSVPGPSSGQSHSTVVTIKNISKQRQLSTSGQNLP